MANRRPGNGRNNAAHHQPDELGKIDVYDLFNTNNSLGRNVGTNMTSHYTSPVPFIPYMHTWGDGQQQSPANIRPNSRTHMPHTNPSNSINGSQRTPFNGMAQQPQRSQAQMAPPTAITNGSSMFQGSGIVNPMAQAFAVRNQASQQAMWSANMPIKPTLVAGFVWNGDHPYTDNPYTQARFEAPNHSTSTTINVAEDIRVDSPRIPISTPPPPPPQRSVQPTPTTKRCRSEQTQPPQKRQQFQQPPEPEEPQQAEAVPLFPYGLDTIYAENQRMEAVEREWEQQKPQVQTPRTIVATTSFPRPQPQPQKPQEQASDEFRWPGDTSNYPCEAFADIDLPESKYRPQIIHMGTPKSETRYTVGVYALRPANYGGDNVFEYRIARDGADIRTIAHGELIPFNQIVLNKYFTGMKRSKVEDWIRCLMALVPGCDNALMRWKRADSGDVSTAEAPNGREGH
ncbi:hypothetical protein F5Y04DRAFT_282816 [Hypomontagnella monticulosa]|nr:hypothetical protein F5Y04DRAFT_282816 [Hypomontagnella monticulosa]